MALFATKPPAVKPAPERTAPRPQPARMPEPVQQGARPSSLVSRLRNLNGAGGDTAPDIPPPSTAQPASHRPLPPVSAAAPIDVRDRPSRRKLADTSVADKLAAVQNTAYQQVQASQNQQVRAPKPEEGPYPAASFFSQEEWAAIDDGNHHVFEVRTADGKHSTLSRLPHEKLGPDDMIGILFDRTIVVIGTTRQVQPPSGYKSIRVEMKNLGGDASILFPETRPFLKELSTRVPVVITTKAPPPARKKPPSLG